MSADGVSVQEERFIPQESVIITFVFVSTQKNLLIGWLYPSLFPWTIEFFSISLTHMMLTAHF